MFGVRPTINAAQPYVNNPYSESSKVFTPEQYAIANADVVYAQMMTPRGTLSFPYPGWLPVSAYPTKVHIPKELRYNLGGTNFEYIDNPEHHLYKTILSQREYRINGPCTPRQLYRGSTSPSDYSKSNVHVHPEDYLVAREEHSRWRFGSLPPADLFAEGEGSVKTEASDG